MRIATVTADIQIKIAHECDCDFCNRQYEKRSWKFNQNIQVCDDDDEIAQYVYMSVLEVVHSWIESRYFWLWDGDDSIEIDNLSIRIWSESERMKKFGYTQLIKLDEV